MGFWNRKKEKGLTEPFVTVEMAVATNDENANKTTITDLSTQGITAFGVSEAKQEEEDVKPKEEEEWIWVEGYKAVYHDMSAKHGDMKYEIGETYTLDGKVELCRSGYHFCLKPEHVNGYYSHGRLFKVRGEVRKSDYDKFGPDGTYNTMNGGTWTPAGYRMGGYITVDKLAARSIVLVEEVTDLDILKTVFAFPPFCDTLEDWEEYVPIALKGNVYEWVMLKFVNKMKGLGYSESIANILFNDMRDYKRTKDLYDFAVGLDEMDISNDMKLYMVINRIKQY